jgi:hypothetical protein
MQKNVAVAMGLCLVLGASPALAGVIDIGQVFGDTLRPYIDGAVNALIVGVLGFIAAKLKSKWNIDIEAKHREALTTFLTQKASALVAAGAVKLSGVKVEVKNEAVALAANEALRRIPDALAYFGLTTDMLRQRIIDLLPKEPAVAAAAAIALDVANPATPSAAPATQGSTAMGAAQMRPTKP